MIYELKADIDQVFHVDLSELETVKINADVLGLSLYFKSGNALFPIAADREEGPKLVEAWRRYKEGK